MNQYVIDHIRRSFRETCPERAEELIKLTAEELARMSAADDTINDVRDTDTKPDFQILLTNILYPFVAAFKAMETVGLQPEEADALARSFWEALPKSIIAQEMGGEAAPEKIISLSDYLKFRDQPTEYDADAENNHTEPFGS